MASMQERLDRLNARNGELAAVSVLTPATHPPTAVHEQAFAVLSDLLTMGGNLAAPTGGDGTVTRPVRMLLTVLNQQRHTILEKLAQTPPAEIQRFMGDLEARIHTITSIRLEPDPTPEHVPEHLADEHAPATP